MLRRRTKRSKAQRRTKFSSACFLAPSFFGVLLFFVLPFGVVVYYAFMDNPVGGEFVWLENFVRVWKNGAFRRAAQNTLRFSLTAVPLSVVLSLLLAMLLEAKIPLKSQFRTFFLSPMMVPVASVVLIWQVIFHYNGALNGLLSLFGMEPVDWLKSEHSRLVIVALFLWKNLGYNMILFMAALSDIPRELLEAAEVDGAGPWLRFWKIKLRYLSPSILFVTILSLISSFKIFREVFLLTGAHPYESLYMLQHFMNNVFQNIDYQKLSAAAILMFTVVLIIIGGLFIIESKYGKDVEQ